MLFDDAAQLWVFMWMVYCGLLMGIAYEVFRIIRFILKVQWVVVFLDILFWLTMTGVAGWFIFVANGGIFKYYILFGILFGMLLHFMAISDIIRLLVGSFVAFLRKLANKFNNKTRTNNTNSFLIR